MESLSKYAACAWVRSPLRTPCRILRTSRSFWLIEIRSVESTAIDMAPPWPGQGGHFYRVMTGHFYCCSTVLQDTGCLDSRRCKLTREITLWVVLAMGILTDL